MVQTQLVTVSPGVASNWACTVNAPQTSGEQFVLPADSNPADCLINLNCPYENGIITTSKSNHEQLDNMRNSIEEHISSSSCLPDIQSTATVSNNTSLDNVEFIVDNEYPKEATSRRRNDSTNSVDSSSSSEMFPSHYTDTVSSTTSSSYLLKPSSDSEEESQDPRFTVEEAINDGYMSYSSTEILNEGDDDDDNDNEDVNQQNLLSLNSTIEKSETAPMLETVQASSCQNTDGNLTQNLNLNDHFHHSLSPIQENEIVTFVEEISEPKLYTKITDNIVVADESFLFNSVTNLGELEFGKNGKRAATMHNLHERSSFLDLTEISKVGKICQKALIYLKDDMTLGSLASLNTITAKENAKDPTQSLSLISGKKTEDVLHKSNYTKNLIALSISITLLYIAIGSVRNLQSSINHEGGVGVIGLAVNFVGYVVGSMFSSSVVQNFHPRRCIIANLFPNLLYVAANLYPTMWVMIPVSLIQGLSLAIVSNATSTYITFLAKGYAEKIKGTFSQLSGRFFGTYCLIYQSHLIVGNLIASFILATPGESAEPKPYAALLNSTANESTPVIFASENNTLLYSNQSSHLPLCGAGFCQHFEIGGSRFSVHIETKILLFGVYIGCIILSLINAIFLLEPLNKSLFKTTASPVQSFKSQMCSLGSFFGNVKFILLLPLLMCSAMQFAFMSAEFVKAYVTCPLGIHMIGYTMICFGICSSASSYFCGLLNRYVGRVTFIVAAATMNLGCLVCMFFWQPTLESLIPYFVIMGIWGISDGFWNTQINSLMGIIFPSAYEEAYAGLRITQGLSVAVAFGYSNALCMTMKIYITGAVCIASIVGYLIMEVKHRREQTSCAIKLKQTSV